jgi:uncharacterized protein YkwD
MTGNYIDLIVLLYLFLQLLCGLWKSPLEAFYDILILLAKLTFALMSYGAIGAIFVRFFHLPSAYANALGFFAGAFLAKLILLFIFGILLSGRRESSAGESMPLERLLSAALALLYGLVSAAILFAAVLSVPLPSSALHAIDGSYFAHVATNDPLGVNGKFKDIFSGFYSTALKDFSFLGIKTGKNETAPLGFKTTEVQPDPVSEERMLEMVNRERLERGLKALSVDEKAREAARVYGRYLFANGFISHTDLQDNGPDARMKAAGISYTVMGENLAYAQDVDKAQTGLMKSPEHRENILLPNFNRIGVGAINAGGRGMIFVQEFLD